MKVKDIMHPELVYISPGTTLKEAAQKMKALDCGFLAISNESDDKLTGVITDRDITIRAVADGENSDTATVDTIKTDKVLYCFEDDSIEEAANTMHDNQVYRLIVLDDDTNKRLRGVITLGDIVRHDKTRAAEKAAKGISSKQQQAR